MKRERKEDSVRITTQNCCEEEIPANPTADTYSSAIQTHTFQEPCDSLLPVPFYHTNPLSKEEEEAMLPIHVVSAEKQESSTSWCLHFSALSEITVSVVNLATLSC